MSSQVVKGIRLSVKWCSVVVTALAILCSGYLYLDSLLRSPLLDPDYGPEKKYLQNYIDANDPDAQQEKLLAESYWRRYKDVKSDSYWGIHGPMGIWGARDHFLQHGRREGRIFKPLHTPKELKEETRLAEIYWARYPEIEKSEIWGRHSQLGVLGPWDHFRYRGRFEGRVWGE